MPYLIKTVGIDLASVSSGVSALEMRADTWETRVIDAGALHLVNSHAPTHSAFSQHILAAQTIVSFVKRHKPDLVGIEDFTNQEASHTAFSIAHMGGVLRTLLWQEGYRMLLLHPSRVSRLVVPQTAHRMPGSKTGRITSAKLKKAAKDWVTTKLQAEFTGTGKTAAKQVEDMVEATCYATIAALFFAQYWLHSVPPLTYRQKQMFYVARPDLITKKALDFVATGLMDLPHRYLIRNIPKEHEVYTPEWVSSGLTPLTFVGTRTQV